jgi:hypothetical protein
MNGQTLLKKSIVPTTKIQRDYKVLFVHPPPPIAPRRDDGRCSICPDFFHIIVTPRVTENLN